MADKITYPFKQERDFFKATEANEIKDVVNANADELELKVDKEDGKGLSTNDYTNEDKGKNDQNSVNVSLITSRLDLLDQEIDGLSGVAGNANPDTQPVNGIIRYFANSAGTYVYFNNIVVGANDVTNGFVTELRLTSGSWVKVTYQSENASSLDYIKDIIKNDVNGKFSISDENGNLIAISTETGGLNFLEIITNLINMSNVTITDQNPTEVIFCDEAGYIGARINDKGVLFAVGITQPTPAPISRGPLVTLAPKRVYLQYDDLKTNDNKGCAVYLDHLIRLTNRDYNNIRFKNGTDKILLYPTKASGSSISETVAIETVQGDWDAFSLTTNKITTKLSTVQSKFNIVHCIGDSQTYGQGAGYFSYDDYQEVYWMQALSKWTAYKAINSGFKGGIFVGNIVKRTRSFTYRSVPYIVTGYANGVQGTSILSWLRHTEITERMKSQSITTRQGLWDLLGLGNGTGVDYTGTAAQIRLYSQYCEGQQSPTLTGALYRWLGLGTPSAEGNTITNAEKTAITAKCEDRLNNPQNPYFDRTLTGNHRFSIKKWLERNKTISVNPSTGAITRLTPGVDAGTRVTNSNDYDVCLPTFILFRFSQNDPDSYGVANPDLYAADMQLAIAAVKEQYPNMPVAIAGIDRNLTYFRDLYPNFDLPIRASAGGVWDFQKALCDSFYTTGLGQNEDANKAWIMPIFWTQPTAYGGCIQSISTTVIENPVLQFPPSDYIWRLREGADTGHPGGFAHNDWGYQLESLVAYSNTL